MKAARRTSLRIRRAELRDRADWLRMREALWPHAADEHAPAIDGPERVLPEEDLTIRGSVASP